MRRGSGVEVYLPLQLLVGYALACFCFLVGIPFGGWQFWLSAAVTAALAFRRSPQTGCRLLALEALMVVLTLYTFTYLHCDACTCHLPMSRFIEEGWNPVREASLEAVFAHFAEHGITSAEDPNLRFHALHVVADPKFVQILAAQMQAGCRFFTAAGYPLWLLFFTLVLTAWRTAREVFQAPRWAAALLAVLLACNPEVTSGSFRGQVDFVTYAAIVLAALSLLLWSRGRRRSDLVLFFSALVIALVSKFNGAYVAMLFLAVAFALGRRERDMRRGILLFLASLLLFALLPYWTAAWWYGSPFYPAHTFRSDVILPDLTHDFFEANDDALRMGYLARLVWAYVSPDLATGGCRLWYGAPDFAPAWRKEWLAEGFEPIRCCLIWSGLAVAFIRSRRDVLVVTLALYLSFFLMPTKYIGFTRYVAQVHAAVLLAWFAFGCRLPTWGRRAVMTLCLLIAVALVRDVGDHFIRQMRSEGVVQRNLDIIRASPEPYAMQTRDPDEPNQDSWIYALEDRFSCEGLKLGINRPGRRLAVDFQMILEGDGLIRIRPEWPLSWSDRFPRPVLR